MNDQAMKLSKILVLKQCKLVTAESCTGGGVAKLCTDLVGASAWFERGFVTYSNEAKIDMLGVPKKLIEQNGAVSREVAIAMARGALLHSNAEVSVAITGVAGPGGGTREKPVGLVWFAFGLGENIIAKRYYFAGTRDTIRTQAIDYALQQLLRLIQG